MAGSCDAWQGHDNSTTTPISKRTKSATKRCLAEELEQPEVFDISWDVDSGARLEGTKSPAEPRQSSPLSSVSSATTHTPGSDAELVSLKTDNNQEMCDECCDPQVDAWDLDSWQTTTLPTHSSPCGAALSLGRAQREVADAVVNELRIDLEAATQQTVNQMSSWISEEIAFARKGFEDDFRKSVEEVERLRCLLDEQVCAIRELEGQVASQVAQKYGSGDTLTSPAVIEAQKVADERRWRIRFDAVQERVEKQSQSIVTLEKRSSELSERVDAHSASIVRDAKAIQNVESRMAAELCANSVIHASIDRRLGTVEGFGRTSEQLAERLSILESAIKSNVDSVLAVEKVVETLHGEMPALREGLQDCGAMMVALDEQSKVVAERAALRESATLDEDRQFRLRLDALQAGFDDQARNLETARKQCCDLLNAGETDRSVMLARLDWQGDRLDLLKRKSEDISEAVARVGSTVVRVDAALNSARDERLAELAVVCAKLGQHGDQLEALPAIRQAQAQLAEQLAGKADLVELASVRGVVEARAQEAHETHQNDVVDFGQSLKQAQAAFSAHDAYVRRLKPWLKEVVARMEKIEHKLVGLVENIPTDQLHMWEECLKVL